MQPRNAAFALLRRLALQGFKPLPPKGIRWAKPIVSLRPLSYHATSRLRSSETPLQVPPPKTRAEAPSSSAPTEQPAYEMTFTCRPCGKRSSHRVSKQGYHHGSVLITCPGCKNRHVISDHLNIFGDKSITIEDLMRDKGQLVKKGTLSEDGDLEFWEDGSTTRRVKTEKPAKEDDTPA